MGCFNFAIKSTFMTGTFYRIYTAIMTAVMWTVEAFTKINSITAFIAFITATWLDSSTTHTITIMIFSITGKVLFHVYLSWYNINDHFSDSQTLALIEELKQISTEAVMSVVLLVLLLILLLLAMASVYHTSLVRTFMSPNTCLWKCL